MEAMHIVNTRISSNKEMGKTNVRDVKLAVATTYTTSHSTSIAACAASCAAASIATLHTTAETTAGSGRSDKPWFRLPVLFPSSAQNQTSSSPGKSYFAYVDKSAHQILIAKSGHGRLRLLPRSIFHNSRVQISSECHKGHPRLVNQRRIYDLPASLHETMGKGPNPSIHQSQQRPEEKKNQKKTAMNHV